MGGRTCAALAVLLLIAAAAALPPASAQWAKPRQFGRGAPAPAAAPTPAAAETSGGSGSGDSAAVEAMPPLPGAARQQQVVDGPEVEDPGLDYHPSGGDGDGDGDSGSVFSTHYDDDDDEAAAAGANHDSGSGAGSKAGTAAALAEHKASGSSGRGDSTDGADDVGSEELLELAQVPFDEVGDNDGGDAAASDSMEAVAAKGANKAASSSGSSSGSGSDDSGSSEDSNRLEGGFKSSLRLRPRARPAPKTKAVGRAMPTNSTRSGSVNATAAPPVVPVVTAIARPLEPVVTPILTPITPVVGPVASSSSSTSSGSSGAPAAVAPIIKPAADGVPVVKPAASSSSSGSSKGASGVPVLRPAVDSATGPPLPGAIAAASIDSGAHAAAGGNATAAAAAAAAAGGAAGARRVRPPSAKPPKSPKPVARITVPSHDDRSTVKARSGELTPVTFDASNSSDAEAFSWSLSQIRPATRAVDLALPFPEPASFEAPLAPGEYLVALRVAGPGGHAEAQRLVTVQRNAQPVANAGGPYTGYVGRPVRVSAARSRDPDGDALRFRWTLTLAGAGADEPPVAVVDDVDAAFTLSRVGEYALRLEADDGRGGASVTQADLLVLPASLAPAGGGGDGAAPLVQAAPMQQQPMQQQTIALPAPVQQQQQQQAAYVPPNPAEMVRRSAALLQQQVAYTPQQLQPRAAGGSPYSIAAAGDAPSSQRAQMPQSPQQLGNSGGIPLAGRSVATPTPAPLAPNKPSPNVLPQCLFDRATGVGVMAYDVLGMPPLTDLAAWARQEWRDCTSGPVKPFGARGAGAGGQQQQGAAAPPGRLPPTIGATVSTPSGPLAAAIAAPDDVVTTGGNATARVALDAAGSASAPLRPIVLYAWSVKRLPDGLQVAAATGRRTQVWLPPGVYAASLLATDLMGATASAAKVFAVWPVKDTTAAIGSPAAFVAATDSDGAQVWGVRVWVVRGLLVRVRGATVLCCPVSLLVHTH